MTGINPIIDLDELLHPEEQVQFRRLCIDTEPEEIAPLAEMIQLHVQQIEEHSATADVEVGISVANALTVLVTAPTTYDAEERALIRGAVEYFLLDDDAEGDLTTPMGFDDDARVANSVLRRLDRPDLVIDLGSLT